MHSVDSIRSALCQQPQRLTVTMCPAQDVCSFETLLGLSAGQPYVQIIIHVRDSHLLLRMACDREVHSLLVLVPPPPPPPHNHHHKNNDYYKTAIFGTTRILRTVQSVQQKSSCLVNIHSA
jgi:hypothetical protein